MGAYPDFNNNNSHYEDNNATYTSQQQLGAPSQTQTSTAHSPLTDVSSGGSAFISPATTEVGQMDDLGVIEKKNCFEDDDGDEKKNDNATAYPDDKGGTDRNPNKQTDSAGYEIEELPGTSLLIRDKGGIVLSPRPTTSPNDPLNWNSWRKWWHTFLVCFIAGFTAATSNDAGSAQFGEHRELNITYDAMNTGAGVLFLGIGYGTLAISPAAWLWGRRSSYMFCILMGMLGSIWMAKTRNTSDSIWCQLFVGISESCAEANVQLSLSDLFFEHQRGTVLSIYVLATSVGTFLGPMIASFISDSPMGWRWIGWWAVIISGATLVTLYFGLEETMFDRPSYEPNSTNAGQVSDSSSVNNLATATGMDEKKAYDNEQDLEKGSSTSNNMPNAQALNGALIMHDEKKSYWERIRLFTPAHNLKGWGFKQFAHRLVLTLRVFTFPAVIYSGIQWGAQDAWLTFYVTVEDDNWSEAPWHYGDVGVGLMNLPCVIGAVLGCMYGGYFSDEFMIWMAKRNNGVTEAEHRLWMMFPLAILNPLGMLLFGIGTGQGWDWPVPYVGLGLIGFGWGCTGDLSMAYLMDAYPEMVLEGMVGVSVINNSLACIFTFTASLWLDSQGVQNTFIVIAIIDFVFVMTTVPMMIWGKDCRRWTTERYQNFVRDRDSL